MRGRGFAGVFGIGVAEAFYKRVKGGQTNQCGWHWQAARGCAAAWKEGRMPKSECCAELGKRGTRHEGSGRRQRHKPLPCWCVGVERMRVSCKGRVRTAHAGRCNLCGRCVWAAACQREGPKRPFPAQLTCAKGPPRGAPWGRQRHPRPPHLPHTCGAGARARASGGTARRAPRAAPASSPRARGGLAAQPWPAPAPPPLPIGVGRRRHPRGPGAAGRARQRADLPRRTRARPPPLMQRDPRAARAAPVRPR
ncbi:MAG: hypothetical protein J3K34DRAFT_446364 [Monoraphidium minutum]|nr:MAG: hypothetical protein J3K34DRAFT_446364 [Monoraphidium minutum]